MAKKTEVPAPAEETVPVAGEDIYTVEELAAASREVFGVPRECVVASLKPLNKETMTVSEAKAAVEKFMKKEVR